MLRFLRSGCSVLFRSSANIFGYHLIELAAGFALTAILAYILESRAGSVHDQGWEFYATVVCLYLIFAFSMFCVAVFLAYAQQGIG